MYNLRTNTSFWLGPTVTTVWLPWQLESVTFRPKSFRPVKFGSSLSERYANRFLQLGKKTR